jgi:hypothetical protein
MGVKSQKMMLLIATEVGTSDISSMEEVLANISRESL